MFLQNESPAFSFKHSLLIFFFTWNGKRKKEGEEDLQWFIHLTILSSFHPSIRLPLLHSPDGYYGHLDRLKPGAETAPRSPPWLAGAQVLRQSHVASPDGLVENYIRIVDEATLVTPRPKSDTCIPCEHLLDIWLLRFLSSFLLIAEEGSGGWLKCLGPGPPSWETRTQSKASCFKPGSAIAVVVQGKNWQMEDILCPSFPLCLNSKY